MHCLTQPCSRASNWLLSRGTLLSNQFDGRGGVFPTFARYRYAPESCARDSGEPLSGPTDEDHDHRLPPARHGEDSGGTPRTPTGVNVARTWFSRRWGGRLPAASMFQSAGRKSRQKEPPAMSISMIGLDTAKSVFRIHAMNKAGDVLIRRKLRRGELIPFFKKQVACKVVMEACGAAHHLAGF